LTDEDEIPPVPDVPITRSGDLWLLGKGCKFGSEPGGAPIVELLQCFYAGPVEQANEIREQA
jgi:hypothetical protein